LEKIKKDSDDEPEPEPMELGSENLEEVVMCPLVFERSRPRQNAPDEYLEEGVFDISRQRPNTQASRKQKQRRMCLFCGEWHFERECRKFSANEKIEFCVKKVGESDEKINNLRQLLENNNKELTAVKLEFMNVVEEIKKI
jgi:hypothetical protein